MGIPFGAFVLPIIPKPAGFGKGVARLRQMVYTTPVPLALHGLALAAIVAGASLLCLAA